MMNPSDPRKPLRGVARAAAALALAATLVVTVDVSAEPREVKPLLVHLRVGGHVLACRHAATDAAPRGGDRVLSAAGREQARRMGEAIRTQRIPVGDVLSSPRPRAVETARLAFGRAEASDALAGDGRHPGLAPLVTGGVRQGANRVLVADEPTLRAALPQHGRAPIAEGDCLVVRDGTIVARVTARGWSGLRTDR